MQREPMHVAPERSARARDAARLLPVFGLFLLMPPMISLFAVPADVAGVPMLVLYLFAVWLGLVIGAAVIGRLLEPRTPPDDPPPPA
jgi:hypothetical protein